MAKPKRILIVCPAAPSGVHPLTLHSLMALEHDGAADYLILRNDNPEAGHYDDLTAKLNRARGVAMAQQHDAMLIVEADMIVPTHALRRMLKVRAADVVYGLYCSRRDHHGWLAYSEIQAAGGGTPISADRWGKVTPSAGVGFGCTFINHRVLEAFEFRNEPQGQGPDWYFALDAAEAGFNQKHDLGVVCGHIINTNPLRIAWPTETGHRVEEPRQDTRNTQAEQAADGVYTVLKPLTFVNRRNYTAKAGETTFLTAAQAARFLRSGHVEPYQEDE